MENIIRNLALEIQMNIAWNDKNQKYESEIYECIDAMNKLARLIEEGKVNKK